MRRQRRVAVEEDGIVVVGRIVGSRKRHELQFHARQRRLGPFHRRIQRGPALGGGRRIVGDRQLLQRRLFPIGQDGRGQGVHHPCQPHHQHPGRCHHAQQIVVVQPPRPRRLLDPHRPERQPTHEGRIQHHARHHGDDQQQPHRAQKQHSRQTQEHVGVKLKQELHRRMTGDQRRALAAGLVDGLETVFAGRGVGGAAGDVHHRPVLVEAHEGRNLARMFGQTGGQHLVQRQQSAVRVLRRPRLMQQRLVQLVAEHQRQSRDAQHQQEQGRDQARPLVRPGPGADRPGVHRPARIRTRSRPTDARFAARPASDSSIPDSRRRRPTDPRPRHSRPGPAASPACRPP